MQRIKQELKGIKQLERSSLKYLAVVVAAALAVGTFAFALGGGTEADLFMRGDTHTVNDFSGYKMNGTQSNTARSAFVETSTGGQTVDWGVRVWKRDVNGTETEITGGNPTATVTRTSAGSGIQSATWTPPETNMNPGDALLWRVYIRVGSGWDERAEFITNRMNASQLKNDPMTVFYYTEYETQTGGAPFNRYTRGTFRWGTSTYNSRVENLNHTIAKVAVNQTTPSSQIDTYPGQKFKHEAEVTCDASFCQDVTVQPQLCNGGSCTSFSNVNDSMGLSWDQDSYTFGTLERGETVTQDFSVSTEDEGDYRIRFNVTSSNVMNNVSQNETVDVHVADVNLTEMEHENRFEASVNEYETGDTIDWFNTSLEVSGGTAFNLTVAPEFLEPSGGVAVWGPDTRKSCGNVSAGSTCERQFSNYEIPVDAESGDYNFSVGYDWDNFGPETNASQQFRIVDVRGTFSSTLSPDSILKGESSEYSFSMTNEWSSALQDVNVSINCGSGLTCEGLDSNYWSSLSSGQTVEPTFNVSSTDTTGTGYHDINVTVEYDNPNENRVWSQVENQDLKVTSSDTLLTTIHDLADNVTRGETLDLEGNLENIGDSTAYEVWLNWSAPSGWQADSFSQYNDSVGAGETIWNNISTDVTLSAERGTKYVNLTSNNSDGTRGDRSIEMIEVYADTTTSLSLNATDAARGEKVQADVGLNLDTGGALGNQRIELKNLENGENLGYATTDTNGETSITFKVGEDWNVTEHDISAVYDGNSTIYTNPSNSTAPLNVHDLPAVENVSYTPEVDGFGQRIHVNASVEDGDNVSNVDLNVSYPGGSYSKYAMKNVDGDVYAYNFTDTWVNGVYEFRIEAEDDAGYTNKSGTYEFQVRANTTKNVVTGKDVYGPNEYVSLSRTEPVEKNSSNPEIIQTLEAYAEELFSESFDTQLGSSTYHSYTHEMDGQYFQMSEQNGAPPSTPDRFEGVYTYNTKLENFTRIDLESYGNVSAGDWEVQVQDYSTDTWETLFTKTSTTDSWNNVTVCSGSSCDNYVRNGDIGIRVYETSDRGTAEQTYGVDFQKLRVEAEEGPVSKDTEPAEPYIVGEHRYNTRRLYDKFNLTELPYYDSASIQSAEIVFSVPSGYGTGEIYHTKNFTESDSANTIHKDGTPPEQNDPNPVGTFSTGTGTKIVDVTDAVNDTFEAGKRHVGFQFREQGEDTFYNISGPIYLRINYSAESELLNTGNTDMEGYLVMRVQRDSSGTWENVGFPVVDQSDGVFGVNSGGSVNLSRVWDDHGGFNTQLRSPDRYRVISRYVDPDGNTLQTDSGESIQDTYEFEIAEAELNLTDIEHENLVEYSINQYETRDNIEWINVTINNSEAEAVDAIIDLNILDKNDEQVSWGPDSTKSCGDIAPGDSCEKQWNNSGLGYEIPEDATPGTFEFNWNTTLEAENAETTNNYSIGFFIHHVPSELSSEILDTDNKIMRNESAIYNFTVNNPWTGDLSGVNVTVNCNDAELDCNVAGGATDTANLGTVGSSEEVSFNISTDQNTAPENYDINATLEYVNPGMETKTWKQQENRILQVRIPGALLNLTDHPEMAVRGDSGYYFESYANNTYENDLTNETITWYIPDGWNNASGSLEVEEEVHEPGEVVWNNFTAELYESASLGTTRINITTTNDQGREDNDFVRVDVYSDTSIAVSFNQSDPAVEEPVEIRGILEYRNGTPIQDETLEFRDETTGTYIGSSTTDSSGIATQEYSPGTPYANHTINVSYSGSSDLYTLGKSNTKNLTVHDRPNITDVSATPPIIGFGYNMTINASISDRDGVSDAWLEVEQPDGTIGTYNMENLSGVWEHNFSETWSYGNYDYRVYANDSYDKVSVENGSFLVFINQKSAIQSERYDYYPAEYVNLTNGTEAWWNKTWDFRRRIQVNETSGNLLVDYPSRAVISNLGGNTDNCEDLRVVENQALQDIYVDSCNPSGDSVIYFSSNLSASSSENAYLYYGNPNASAYETDRHAYSIVDSGTYDPGQTTVENTHSYNDGSSTFRQIDVTVYGDSLYAEVNAYNYIDETWETLYSGNPGTGTNVINQLYLDNPMYSQVNVQLEDTSNNPGNVYYAYNFTTPDYVDTAETTEEDSMDSILQNTGNTSFKGRVVLEVERNTSGSWESVSTEHNDSSPRTVEKDSSVNFANLWNNDPFYTDGLESGFYRTVFRLVDPYGNVLEGPTGALYRSNTFRLNPPQSDVNVQDLRVYNVTESSTPETDTSDLEDSGTNSTLQIYGGDTYRFEVVVNNSQNADADWKIDPGDVIRHYGLNETWNIDPTTEIFYTNGTDTYTGGSFNGTIEWNTSDGGTLRPGNNATFAYIIDVPNSNEYHDIIFNLEDQAFTVQDDSDLDVIREEQIPPEPLMFDLNTTEVLRGDKMKAYANWSEEIGDARAEYNSTSSVLNNFSVTPEGTWTNYTVSTDSDWTRGNHSFRFHAADLVGNWNATWKKWFTVFAPSKVNDSTVNDTRVGPGEPVRFRCQVTTETGDAIQDYNVSFYNETSRFDYNETVSNGWVSTTYSSDQIGFQNLTCEISEDYDRFYKPVVENATEEIRVAEDEAPNYFEYGANRSRIFKTTTNDTAGFYSRWTDNYELDFGALVKGDVYTDTNKTLPDAFDLTQLSGAEDWANFTIDIPSNHSIGDQNWTIHVNDTSSNINSTEKIGVDIWAWTFVDSANSGPDKNPVAQGEEFKFYCNFRQGNGTGVTDYPVSFWDNNTADGSWRQLGTNQTQSGDLQGYAQWSQSYLETGYYDFKCNTTENSDLNLKPYTGYESFSDVIEVKTGDVYPPNLVDSNYGLNDSAVYKNWSSILSYAQWNESIDTAWVEYNSTNETFQEEVIEEPYTNNWTNFTFTPDTNWTVGEHWIKTYANDTHGNLNDTLEYLRFEVWGHSEVEWLSPTGTVEQDNATELRCGVYDNQTSTGIENYSVDFYDDSSNLIGTNTTDETGEAVYHYNTSGVSTGEKTWSCRIQDSSGNYYNASSNDTDSETVNLVSAISSYLTGDMIKPPSGTTLAQNRTFEANFSASCGGGDCGSVSITPRYNQSGAADTTIPEGSGTPFHTVGSNTQSCNLQEGETCYRNFTINATGEKNSVHALDAYLESSDAENNDTEDHDVTIDVILVMNVTYPYLAFGTGRPGDILGAPENGQGEYNIKLDENSNAATGGAWMRETSLTRLTGPDTSNRRILPENTTWAMESSCSYTGSNKLREEYSQLTDYLGAGESITTCFWQEIPYGKYEGTYNGTITIKVNTTE